MQINQSISWQSVDWPLDQPAQYYALFLGDAPTPSQVVAATMATVPVDDSGAAIWLIRPCDAASNPTSFGPAQAVVAGTGQIPARAWLRDYVRKRLTDRTAAGTVKFQDDVLNDLIHNALRDYSLRFPIDRSATIALATDGTPFGIRSYQMPDDVRVITRVAYVTRDGRTTVELAELPWKGGETSATSLLGAPLVGLQSVPSNARFYGNHYTVWQGSIRLDFRPHGDGDTLIIEYKGLIPLPTSDAAFLPVALDELEIVALFTEVAAWEILEGADVALSRWRTRDDGRRDDLPTDKMSKYMRRVLEDKLREKRTLRPRRIRLVRT